MKILIAVPTFESIYPDTFKSIYELQSTGHQLFFDFVRGYDCATARNNIVFCAKVKNVDYVLMVDNDIVLPSDALINMLQDSKEVCLGVYAHRNNNNQYDGNSCLYKLGEYNYTNLFTSNELKLLRNAGDYKISIHGGGMGCALIKTSVFDKIEYPWYDWVNYPNKGILSEDLYFCEQCHQHNIAIYADTRVFCGHIFRYIQEVV